MSGGQKRLDLSGAVLVSGTTICSKSETSMSSQKSATLFNRIRANIRERSSSRHKKREEKEKEMEREKEKGIPPRPIRSSSTSSKKDSQAVKANVS